MRDVVDALLVLLLFLIWAQDSKKIHKLRRWMKGATWRIKNNAGIMYGKWRNK